LGAPFSFRWFPFHYKIRRPPGPGAIRSSDLFLSAANSHLPFTRGLKSLPTLPSCVSPFGRGWCGGFFPKSLIETLDLDAALSVACSSFYTPLAYHCPHVDTCPFFRVPFFSPCSVEIKARRNCHDTKLPLNDLPLGHEGRPGLAPRDHRTYPWQPFSSKMEEAKNPLFPRTGSCRFRPRLFFSTLM